MRLVAKAGLVALVAVAIGVPAYMLAPAVGSVSGRALQESVADQVGGGTGMTLDPCRGRGRAWVCPVWVNVRSGAVSYRVTRHGRRCWHAELDPRSRGSRMPASADGCVRLRDQLRVGSRILGD